MQANPAAIAIHGYDKNEKSFIGKSSLLWVDWNDRPPDAEQLKISKKQIFAVAPNLPDPQRRQGGSLLNELSARL
jgi:hypothetical protein